MESDLSIEQLLSGEKLPLKRVEYEWGVTSGNRKGEVVYEIRDKKVIFSAIRSAREAPSSVNAAEAIIVAICDAEGIDWKDPSFCQKYEFYDLSTPIGYPWRKDPSFQAYLEGEGEVQIDKLEIKPTGNYLHVESWTPVNLEGKGSIPQLKSKSVDENS